MNPFLILAFWLGVVFGGVAIWCLLVIYAERANRRHLQACIEASTQGGTSTFHERLCKIVTGVDR